MTTNIKDLLITKHQAEYRLSWLSRHGQKVTMQSIIHWWLPEDRDAVVYDQGVEAMFLSAGYFITPDAVNLFEKVLEKA